jgi:hypothetical protein
MTLSINNGSGKKTRSIELPAELSGKVWLHMDGNPTPQGVRWSFRENGVYQIQQDSDRLLLVFLRRVGTHYILRSYLANWLTTFTDSQLIGREVLEMTKEVKPCPHCGGRELKIEIVRDSHGMGSQFTGRVLCLGKGCSAVTSWRVGVSRESLKKAAMTVAPKKGKTSNQGETGSKSMTPKEERVLEEKLARDFVIEYWNARAGIKTSRR